jgi:hypothetical protein
MSDRLTVFPSRNPQGTLRLGDSVVEIQKKKFGVKTMCPTRLLARASVHELCMDYKP